MKRVSKTALLIGLAVVAGAGLAGVAIAAPDRDTQSTPKNWNYEIKDGKRVPKGGNRIVNSDGSWREEVRQGNCVTVKERTKTGEYKETRQCNPN